MTGKDIIDALTNMGLDSEEFQYTDLKKRIVDTDLTYIGGVGAFKTVETETTADYSGPSCQIIHFVDHDRYIKIDGHYTSHVGESWDNWYPVQPKEVVIKSWEEVK